MKPPKHDPKHPKVTTLFRKEGWLEHLELELEPNLREDLELLLRNSKSDRNEFASLKATRDLVKKSDDVLLPESGHYYMNLHDRIMSAIEDEAPRTSTMRVKMAHRFSWGAFAGTMTAMLALVSWVSLKTSTPDDSRATAAIESASFDRDLASVAKAGVNVSQELNGFESESEIVTAALEEKLKNLSPDQATALLASLQ
ncbi:MAG TPA: hypothetical protein VM432_12480 [Bdellovibrionales bacterium]|nr:hypothetical protein [Bdellovibrionales bacterium]